MTERHDTTFVDFYLYRGINTKTCFIESKSIDIDQGRASRRW